MDKRYQFDFEGKTYFKNVAPEYEEKFFELYGEYNPTLISDEVGKSQGTNQSQNNQQENTGFNLEDGSLDSSTINQGYYAIGNSDLSIVSEKSKEEMVALFNDEEFVKQVARGDINVDIKNDTDFDEFLGSIIGLDEIKKYQELYDKTYKNKKPSRFTEYLIHGESVKIEVENLEEFENRFPGAKPVTINDRIISIQNNADLSDEERADQIANAYLAPVQLGEMNSRERFMHIKNNPELYHDDAGFVEKAYSFMPDWMVGWGTQLANRATDLFIEGPIKAIESEKLAKGIQEGKTREEMMASGELTDLRAFDVVQSELNKFAIKEYDEEGKELNVIDLIERGEYSKAGGLAGEQAFSNIYSVVLAGANPYVAGVALGTGVYGDEYTKAVTERFEAEELTDEVMNDIRLNSAIKAGGEFVGELIGGTALRYSAGLIKSGAKKEIVKEANRGFLERGVRGFVGGFAGEAVAEGVTNNIQQASDQLIYGDEKTFRDYYRGALNDGLIGGLMGGPIAGSTRAVTKTDREQVQYVLAPEKWRAEVAELNESIENAKRDLENTDDKTKPYVQKRIDILNKKKDRKKQELNSIFKNKSQAELLDYANTIDERNNQIDLAFKENISDEGRQAARDAIKQLNAKLNQETDGFVDEAFEEYVGDVFKGREILDKRGVKWGFGSKSKLKSFETTDKYIKTIKEETGADATGAEGLFYDGKTKTIYIDKQKAAEVGALNVYAHEILHYVMSRNFKTDNESMKPMVDALKQYLVTSGNQRVIDRIENRMRGNGDIDADGQFKEGKMEEYFEILSDLMDTRTHGNYVKLDKNKTGSLIKPFKDFVVGLGFKKVNLTDGEAIFDFIKTYSTNINRSGILGEITKRGITRVKLETDIKGVEKADKKKTTKPTVKESRDSKPAVDKLAVDPKTNKNYTQQEWDRVGADRAIKTLKKQDLMDNLIAAKYKVKDVPPSFVDDVLGSREFLNMINRFNRGRRGKVDENDSLFGYIQGQLRFRADDIFKEAGVGQVPKGKKVETDARTTEGKTREVADVDTSMETFTDNINYFETEVQPENTESKAEQSKLRKEIGIGNLGKGEIFKKVRTALATSKAADEKGFIRDYEKNLASLLEPTIARILNDPSKLKKFRKGILEAIPIKTLVQMQKFLPEKIFVKDHGRQTNLTNLSKFVEKGLLPADILNNTPESKKRRAAGVRVYERLNTTTGQFENYIDAPVVDPKTGKRSGTRGNNRAKVISEVSKAIGRDATPEALTPEFVEDYLNIKNLKGKITPGKVIENISEQIERSPALKFSKGAGQVDNIIAQVDPNFEQDGISHIDKILEQVLGEGEGIYRHRTKDEVDNFFYDVENVLIPNLPVDLVTRTVIRPSNRIFGKNRGGDKIVVDGKETTINDYYNKKRADIFEDIKGGGYLTPKQRIAKGLDPLKVGKPFTGKGKNYKYGKTYGDIFGKTAAAILKSEKDGTAKRANEIHKSMHGQFWQRIHNSLQQDPSNAKVWGNYLSLVGQDTEHPHRMGAEYLGHSANPKGYKGKLYEWEHSMQATRSYLYLLHSSLGGYDFNTAYELVMKDFKLIALDNFDNQKLNNAKRGKSMGPGWNLLIDSWLDRYFHPDVAKIREGINPKNITHISGKTFAEVYNINSDGKPAVIKKSQSDINKVNNAIDAFNKQAELIRKQNKAIQADLEARGYTFVDSEKRGMSTFDFDETVGVSENFVIAKKGNDVQRIASNEWPFVGEQLAKDGYEFDFSDFNKVTKGKPGPLFDKMKNQIKKYGPENVFILTARAPQSEQAIHDWLASNGINIPRKNVTGLGNSTGQAKADWMLQKFAEGYNDMYFVDDALPNVKAVKDVLEQLDIKSKVVQAKIKFSKQAPLDFNTILEQSKGVYAGKRFSAQEARKMGVGKGRLKFFVPPSAEDFKGLVYSFLGRGKEGDAHAAWFKKHLFDPFAKGIRGWNTYKQAMSDDYQAVKKQFKTVGKKLNKKAPGTVFTNDNAIRVYLWDKAGFEIPGITESQIQKLVNHVNNNSDLKNFADALSVISRVPEGYVQPEGYWAVQSIASDLSNTVLKAGRKDYIAEWIQNKNIIFSEENLNKIEAIYGTDFRDALENMLYRMETGTNRPGGKSKQVNMWLDWINGSVAATMFFNIRSAALQTISTVNFINMSDNNLFKAGAAFANQPQYWKDFAFIFNSPMLKQRRAGLQIDVSASEITKAFNEGKSRPEAILAYLLEKGFKPTQIADSFAISAGGAGFYRNRVNTYLKKGMSQVEAKKQAFLDFQEVAEETQQSSRPDLISMQQAGPMGRLILAWQNTPMQMTRLTKKALSDLVKRRKTPGYNQIQSDMGNISSIIYYGVAQNLIFGALQTGLMFLLFGWDEDEERKKKLELRTLNGALDTLLRGTGIYGAAVSTLKNVLLKWKEEREGPAWKRDDWNIAQEAINLSPPIGSKMRKLIGAIRTEKYNKGVSKEIGFRIENPNLSIAANWTEALTNIPVARVVNKANNVEEALNSNNDIWQRVALVSGWSRWSVGVEDEELKAAKESVKEKREKKKEEERKKKREEKKKEEQRKAPKRYKCRKRKADGNRCKNTTTHSSQYCYAHR